MDKLTILYGDKPANKVFSAEGTTTSNAFLYQAKTVEVQSLRGLHDTIDIERANPRAVIIRGVNESLGDNWTERNTGLFPDQPHHWVMLDVDGFEPVLANPVANPLEACHEYISYALPEAFFGADFIWHLSSSHGKDPSKLKVHLFFWFKEAKDSASLKQWAVDLNFKVKKVDSSVFQAVQQHYIADPEFDGIDPFYTGPRLGYFKNRFEQVDLEIAKAAPKAIKKVLPSTKTNIVGEFHRRFSVDDIIDRIIPGEFERVDDRRLTWVNADGGGKGGAYIDDDQQHIGSTHNSWPFLENNGQSLPNLWDIVRVFKFGYADAGLDKFERMATHAPSQQLMVDWAKKELKQFNQLEQKLDSTALLPLFESTMFKMAAKLDLSSNELVAELGAEPSILFNFVEQCYWNTGRNKFYYLDGFEKEFGKEDFGIPFAESAAFYSKSKLNALLDTKKGALSETDFEKLKKAVYTIPIEFVKQYLINNKQAAETRFEVDLFGAPARVVCDSGEALCVRNHVTFYQNDYDSAVVADYKEHFPALDSFLDFIVSSRFASTRREAYLWIHATSGFGKTLLIDMLNNVGGLCLKTHMTEVEAAISGKPSGLTVNQMINTWAIVIDEFKTLKSEIKELTDSLRFSPKNKPMAEVPVYAKIFMSAESVDSLAGQAGVEDQFAKRFSYLRCEGEIDSRELFRLNKPAYKASITAYMAEFINNRIAHYREIGKSAAAVDADNRLAAFHKAKGIEKSFDSLSNNFESIRADFVDYLKTTVQSAINGPASREKQKVYDNCFVDVHGKVYVKSVVKLFKNWLDDNYDWAEVGKIKWKTGEILGEQISVKGKMLTSKSGGAVAHKTRALSFDLPGVSDFDDF